MKRAVWTALVLTGLLAAGAAQGSVSVAVEYEGAYVPLRGHQAALYLPKGWLLLADEGALLAARSADGAQRMAVRAYENADGLTLDALLAEMEGDAAYRGVAPVLYGGFPCIAYAYPQGDTFGAVSMSAGGEAVYFFTFAPYGDEALRRLAEQMLSTLTEAPPQ